MLPFAVQAVSSCASPSGLALALAAEFDDTVGVERAESELDALAAALAPARELAPRAQLEACAELIALQLPSADAGVTLEDLLLHHVLESGQGHPLPVAIAVVDAARRAGIPLGAIGGRGELFLAHAALAEPLVIDPRAPRRPIDVDDRLDGLAWCCAHQLAGLTLDRIAERAEQTGQLMWGLRAAELRLALPVDARVRGQMEQELARVRSRLN